ncbi:hypothetical protein GUY44_11825 [Pimelobacter simplex]|uniref:hypothetical protein n=1 Tax=Nocardioides simplex TaxID=2045 RepID=UPI0005D904E1|nr:hypothetical protein [Pimelobacter simplex]MCG8151170.1 hypothetical protein [Pimelobacter simplex]GEB17238.1 hypothetical protein NSI01_55530 [Pimelobacter simplex]
MSDKKVRRQERRPDGEAPTKRLAVHMPADLHAASKAKAEERGETLSAAVVDLLRDYVKR